MQIDVTCPGCGYATQVSPELVLKKGKAPKCEVCGKKMELPYDIEEELAAAAPSAPKSKGPVCPMCKSALPANSKFCVACGHSGGGDAAERQALLEMQADKRIDNARWNAFFMRLFRWWW